MCCWIISPFFLIFAGVDVWVRVTACLRKMYINYSFFYIYSVYLLFYYRRSLQLMHCDRPTGYTLQKIGHYFHVTKKRWRHSTSNWPQFYSTLILRVVPLHQITYVGVSPRISLKLFGHEIIFEEFQPMWSRYRNVTDGQTTYCGITALCIASRGKNHQRKQKSDDVRSGVDIQGAYGCVRTPC